MIEKELERLVGQELRDVVQVVATVGGKRRRQIGTVIFATESGGFQLYGSIEDARLRPMSSPTDIHFDGDYDESAGLEFVSFGLLPFPVSIALLHTVHDLQMGHERLVGAIFTDSSDAPRFAVTFHLDEPRVFAAEDLWGYLLRTLPNSTRIIVRRVFTPEPPAPSQPSER